MKSLRLAAALLGVSFIALTICETQLAEGQEFRQNTDSLASPSAPPAEAPAGFDEQTNGLVDQGTHLFNAGKFGDVELIADGLGPVYNAQSCRECHQNPVVGSSSQVNELRVGHVDALGRFANPSVLATDGALLTTGRSLINDRATCPEAQMHASPEETVRTFRASLSTLGDGFVEAIADRTLLEIAAREFRESRGAIRGTPVYVDVLEARGQKRIGRFGWKDQHASLLSFAGDAYLNEMGVTNRLFPNEVVDRCNTQPGLNDEPGPDGVADVDRFVQFIRATKVPPRDEALAATLDAQLGSDLFDKIGCGSCHVRTIATAPAGSKINGGAFTVPDALGNKVIHPFSDFLLHDVGTGDGIVQNGGPQTANKLRTAPLWGLRTRSRFLHDGMSLTLSGAIRRHRGEATASAEQFHALNETEKKQLLTFLNSL